MVRGYYPSDYRLLAVRGKDADDYLQRVLTCNLRRLEVGGVIPGALLTGQGKLVAPFRIHREPDGQSFSLEVESGCAEALAARLERYVFSEDVAIEMNEGVRVIELVGVQGELGVLPGVGTYRDLEVSGEPIRLSTVSSGHVRLHAQREVALPLPRLEESEYELWRIERGLPAWGRELDENVIPLALGIDDAFAHDKGCYTGQEVISRAHFVTHPVQELLGVASDTPLAPGTELTVAGDYAGVVTSSALDPGRGSVGLARLRWHKVKPGESVMADSQEVRVEALPMTRT